MKTLNFALGLTALYLLTLSACSPLPLSPVQPIILNTCLPVTACRLPAMHPRTNGELNAALSVTKAAWATCAAQVDAVMTCQAMANER
ncbi:Rz1-like lysis system protein LysC [Paraburkholderia bonniea]|uniref:Rz1-like lysis system protein LysC n=1 Tax=Paraburkholderia bonniea TaxID=2152891 RepID=UPI001C2B8248|nr:Rz1-like lysis system protein LysC [Paraburkholderia bonniea]